ncbi:hypothetical protein K474DRAFT_1380358 [Panus rudis PR-1116 ss-1]|nr:hypothetical protein K474DRAFT_1380358 [Panus rudis PR-1116 ss-1]
MSSRERFMPPAYLHWTAVMMQSRDSGVDASDEGPQLKHLRLREFVGTGFEGSASFLGNYQNLVSLEIVCTISHLNPKLYDEYPLEQDHLTSLRFSLPDLQHLRLEDHSITSMTTLLSNLDVPPLKSLHISIPVATASRSMQPMARTYADMVPIIFELCNKNPTLASVLCVCLPDRNASKQ